MTLEKHDIADEKKNVIIIKSTGKYQTSVHISEFRNKKESTLQCAHPSSLKGLSSALFKPAGAITSCIIQEVVLHGVKPFKTRLRAHPDTTNGTAVHHLHSLNMDLAC